MLDIKELISAAMNEAVKMTIMHEKMKLNTRIYSARTELLALLLELRGEQTKYAEERIDDILSKIAGDSKLLFSSPNEKPYTSGVNQ